MIVRALAVFSLLMAGVQDSSPVEAKTWDIDYTKSKVGFMATQSKQAFAGGFRVFAAQVDFDPAHPNEGKIQASVDIASIWTGSDDRDQLLPQPDWFHTAQFPQAVFLSETITAMEGGRYVAHGPLTIKGKSHPVDIIFTVSPDAAPYWHVKAHFSIMRTLFNVGDHGWATEDYVGFPVDVTMDIVAKP